MAGVLATDIGDRHTALFYLSHIHTLTLAIASLSLVPIMPRQYKPLNEARWDSLVVLGGTALLSLEG